MHEAEKHGAPLTPQETVEMVNKVLSCKTYEDLLKTLSPYYERYNDYHYASIPGNEYWFDMDTLTDIINNLPLPKKVKLKRVTYRNLPSISTPVYVLESVIMLALKYIYLLTNNRKEEAKEYEIHPKTSWSEWWDIYKPVLDAQEDLAQKNKETGINLDI